MAGPAEDLRLLRHVLLPVTGASRERTARSSCGDGVVTPGVTRAWIRSLFFAGYTSVGDSYTEYTQIILVGD